LSIRAAVFDYWGTLVGDSVRRYLEGPRLRLRTRLLREALAAAGRPHAEEPVAAAFRAFEEEHGALQRRGLDIASGERVYLYLELLEPGLAGRLAPEELRAVEEALVTPGRVMPPEPAPGAAEVLQEAEGRGLAIGLVSNTGITPGYVLRGLLDDYGLRPYFRVLTFSDEARLAKPAEEIFRCTLETLDVEPAESVFIGDTPELDVVGPLAVGMWAVQVGDRQLDGVRPHARVDGLPGVFPALERLGLVGG
jgi:HAD superfamily hydrolase (TIGR01509 family)